MNPFMRGVGKAMGMGSDRAATYLTKGSKNASKINAKAASAASVLASAGITGDKVAAHNLAIRARQRQLGARYGATAVGLGVLGSQGKNRSSYRPQRPMTQAPSGSGRYA
jgi:hypothetical protein